MLEEKHLMCIRHDLLTVMKDLPTVPDPQQHEFLWGAFFGLLIAREWRTLYEVQQEGTIIKMIEFLLREPFSSSTPPGTSIPEEMQKVKEYIEQRWSVVKSLPDVVIPEYPHKEMAPQKFVIADALTLFHNYEQGPGDALIEALTRQKRRVEENPHVYPNAAWRQETAMAYITLQDEIDDIVDPPSYELTVSNVGTVISFTDPRARSYETVKQLYDEYVAAGYGQVALWSSKEHDPIEQHDNPDAVDGKY